MKKQTKADRMNESLAMRHGKESTKKQSYASRRHESEGATKKSMHSKMGLPTKKAHKGK